MKVKLIRAARIRIEAGEIVSVSPAEAGFLISVGSAEPVPEPANENPEESIQRETATAKPARKGKK